MPFLGYFLGQVGTHSHDLHSTLLKFSAQFLQPTQLADTIGSPMGPKELDKDQVVIEASRIELNTFVIRSGEMGNMVTYLDDCASLDLLGTDVYGEREKKSNDYGHGRWQRPYQARTLHVGGNTQQGS